MFVIPVTTITATITPSIAAIMQNQRRSVAVIMLSERSTGLGLRSELANVSSPHEKNEVKEQPADEEKTNRKAGQNQRSIWSFFDWLLNTSTCWLDRYFFCNGFLLD